MTLLAVSNLHTHFVGRDSTDNILVAQAINGISFVVESGEILGLVGETGAGKSLTALSIMGLLQPPARIVKGSIQFEGRELVGAPSSDLDRLRGDRITMIVQSPRTSLDPLTRVGDQIVRVHRAHRDASRAEARRRTLDMLAAVGIPDPEGRFNAWPHQFSGGMAQRVMIAMALVNEPQLLIADEPTTGLDVTVQAQILDLLREQVRRGKLGAIIITHDLGVVAHYCNKMAVMFGGSIVEQGPVGSIFAMPRHPYTQSLIASTPDKIVLGGAVLRAGAPPNLYALPEGCIFSDRCPKVHGKCREKPANVAVAGDHFAACHLLT